MKIKTTPFTELIILSTFLGLPFISLAQNVSLDLSFDNDGIVTTSIGTTNDEGRSLTIQPDGKIIVAGYSNSNILSFYNDFALVRYNTNGSLDTTFDTDGKVITPISIGPDEGYSVAIQDDGKILLAGTSVSSSYTDFVLVRYNTNGSLDTTFDNDGIVTTSFGPINDYGYSMALQNDGKIVMAGKTDNGGSAYSDFAIARYNANGSLDTTFDTDGKVITAIGTGDDAANVIAIQSDGRIVVAGVSYTINVYEFALARYNINGSLDTTFDTDGKLTTSFGQFNDYANSIVIQNDGKIVVSGTSYSNGYHFALARYNSNGSLDTTFDNDGKVTTDFGLSWEYANSVAIQSNGKILVAGSSALLGTYSNFALARYNTNGSLDSTLDTDGILTTIIGPFNDFGNSMALQSDGKIVIAGSNDNGSYTDFTLVRYNNISFPLPIELLSFEAKCNEGKIDLNWVIGSQENNDYFTIERANDSMNFESVGTINNISNSNQTIYYSFLDTEPLQGTSYYRLKQTDLDGQHKYFKIVPVICNDLTEISIYPNPNTGAFMIEGAELNSNIIITDVLGQIIHQTKIIEVITEIDLSKMIKGVYFIMIVENGFTSTKKVIINK